MFCEECGDLLIRFIRKTSCSPFVGSLSAAMVKAGFGLCNFFLICESMVAQFLTFVPHGEQTLEESEFFSSTSRDRSARNTLASIGYVFPFLCGAVKMFLVVIHPVLKFPNCVLKQQPHNLRLSDAVASLFGFLPLHEARFFGVV